MDAKQKINAWFEWYLVNQESLVETYNGKYLVIKDFAVVGAFDERIKAHFYGKENFGMGNFMLQLCTHGDEAHTVHLNGYSAR